VQHVNDPSASHNEMRFAEMWRRFGAPCATKLSPDLSVNLSDDL
jgi:hypothetical protein